MSSPILRDTYCDGKDQPGRIAPTQSRACNQFKTPHEPKRRTGLIAPAQSQQHISHARISFYAQTDSEGRANSVLPSNNIMAHRIRMNRQTSSAWVRVAAYVETPTCVRCRHQGDLRLSRRSHEMPERRPTKGRILNAQPLKVQPLMGTPVVSQAHIERMLTTSTQT